LKFVIVVSRRLPVLGLGSLIRTWGSAVIVTVGIVAGLRVPDQWELVVQARPADT
jgi:hypothetical protein